MTKKFLFLTTKKFHLSVFDFGSIVFAAKVSVLPDVKAQNFTKEVLQNFSYLAETGYAEGAICHKLVKGSEEDKKTIAVSIPIIIRSVCNIVCHTFAGAYVDAHLLRSFESEIFKIFTFFGRQRLLSSLRSHQTMVFQIY